MGPNIRKAVQLSKSSGRAKCLSRRQGQQVARLAQINALLRRRTGYRRKWRELVVVNVVLTNSVKDHLLHL